MSPSNSPLTLTQITSPAPQEGCLDPVLLKITEELLEAHQKNEDNESDEDNENEEEEDKDSTEKDEDETYQELKRDIMIDSCVNILKQIEEADTGGLPVGSEAPCKARSSATNSRSTSPAKSGIP
ncbi:hypothetical protein KEM48_010399 [Puccinia striiformis f. sp. tritici PST-130]|nr:hypothetical protein Pst134EB_027431 [Puccinia striiformis f. sp. tritici]KAI9626570.1 hypothetical protein KEM48_010399 [Puccinia striiformis f. sp. tritici PST-130]